MDVNKGNSSSQQSEGEDDDILYQVERANYLAESRKMPSLCHKDRQVSDNDPLAVQSTEDATKATGIGAKQLQVKQHTSVPLLE